MIITIVNLKLEWRCERWGFQWRWFISLGLFMTKQQIFSFHWLSFLSYPTFCEQVEIKVHYFFLYCVLYNSLYSFHSPSRIQLQSCYLTSIPFLAHFQFLTLSFLLQSLTFFFVFTSLDYPSMNTWWEEWYERKVFHFERGIIKERKGGEKQSRQLKVTQSIQQCYQIFSTLLSWIAIKDEI